MSKPPRALDCDQAGAIDPPENAAQGPRAAGSCAWLSYPLSPMSLPFVFLNYRRSQDQVRATKLCGELQRALRDPVFLDRSDIEAGRRWPDALEAALQRATCMLVLIGPRWLHAQDEESGKRRIDQPDDWVRREIEIALEREVRLIPLLLDCEPPSREHLPESIRGLADIQGRPLRSEDELLDLVRILKEQCGFRGRSTASNLADAVHRSLWRKSDQRLRRRLARWGYLASQDVRRQNLRVNERGYGTEAPTPVVAFAGDSGSGRTWELCDYLLQREGEGPVISLRRCTGEARRDLEDAARYLWSELHEGAGNPSLAEVANRIRSDAGPRIVAIDDVLAPAVALELARQDWEAWGMRLALSCTAAVGKELARVAGCTVRAVDRFTFGEARDFFHLSGMEWTAMPDDLRDEFRLPSLAASARRVFGAQWRPETEYEIVEAEWNRRLERAELRDEERRAFHRALVSLAPAVDSSLEPKHFTPGLEAARPRLLRSGCLLEVGSVWQLPGRRLWCWAVAAALVDRRRAAEISSAELCELVFARSKGSGNLDYVAMDAAWLLLRAGALADLNALIEVLEETRVRDAYRLLSTLGPDVLEVLFQRLVHHCSTSKGHLRHDVERGIVRVRSSSVATSAVGLLGSADIQTRLSAARILAEAPTAAALDGLWRLRRDATELRDRQTAFEALRSSVRLDPAWLRDKLLHGDPDMEPIPTAGYLLAGLSDAHALWRETKARLKAIVPPEDERCIAQNILGHRDEEELEWLRERVAGAGLFLAGPILGALALLDPDAAIDGLGVVSSQSLAWSRAWWLKPLLDVRPALVKQALLQRLQADPLPWVVADAYRGYESEIDVPTYRYLLELLEQALDGFLGLRSTDAFHLYSPLQLLAAASNSEHLAELEQRKETPLEQKLTRWLLGAGARESVSARHAEPLGFDLLERIGGEGHVDVVVNWLGAKTSYGRFDGVDAAMRRAHARINDELRKLALRESAEGLDSLVTSRALLALAEHGEWATVLEIVVQRGLAIDPDVLESLRDHGPMDGASRSFVREAWERVGPTPGTVLALGMTRAPEFVTHVLETLAAAWGDNDLSLASVIALGLLGAQDPRSLELLGRALAVSNLQRVRAANALIEIDSPESWHVLLGHIEVDYDDAIADVLSRRPASRARVAELRWARRQAGQYGQLHGGWPESLAWNPRPDVRDFLEKCAFGVCHPDFFSRASAILGLYKLDPDLALDACRAALESDSRKRVEYVGLLLELGSDDSVGALIEYAIRHADDEGTCFMVADALADHDIGAQLVHLLRSSHPNARRAGVVLAGPRESSAELMQALLDVGSDGLNRSIVDRTRETQDRVRRTRSLCESLGGEISERRRWVLLRAIEATACEKTFPLPSCILRRFMPRLPFFMHEYLQEKHAKARKEFLKSLARFDP